MLVKDLIVACARDLPHLIASKSRGGSHLVNDLGYPLVAIGQWGIIITETITIANPNLSPLALIVQHDDPYSTGDLFTQRSVPWAYVSRIAMLDIAGHRPLNKAGFVPLLRCPPGHPSSATRHSPLMATDRTLRVQTHYTAFGLNLSVDKL